MLGAMHGLGMLYADQGKLGEAEKMYQRALEGYEKALGPEHTSTLDTVNNLGLLYKSQGKLDEAEKMYQRALEGYEKALGPEHAATHEPVNNMVYNLVDLCNREGEMNIARAMYSRALLGYQRVFGHDHQECQDVQEKLSALHISASQRNTSADATGHCTPIVSQAMSHSNGRRSTRVSKRRSLLQRLGWR